MGKPPAGRRVGFKAPMYEPGGFGRFRLDDPKPDSVRTRGICSSSIPLASVPTGPRALVLSSTGSLAFAVPRLLASGQTDLQQTNALVWTMVAMAAVGAIITFAFLVYSLWKFRDPKVKNRRYG